MNSSVQMSDAEGCQRLRWCNISNMPTPPLLAHSLSLLQKLRNGPGFPHRHHSRSPTAPSPKTLCSTAALDDHPAGFRQPPLSAAIGCRALVVRNAPAARHGRASCLSPEARALQFAACQTARQRRRRRQACRPRALARNGYRAGWQCHSSPGRTTRRMVNA